MLINIGFALFVVFLLTRLLFDKDADGKWKLFWKSTRFLDEYSEYNRRGTFKERLFDTYKEK